MVSPTMHYISLIIIKKTVSPYFVKRTEAYIKEHLHEPLNVEILAEHAGVSVRTLFTGFKTIWGPPQCLI